LKVSDMGPCQGIRVIDLTRTLPGRCCTLMLADLGAEVITVEPPRVPSAKIEPIGRDTGARYLAINRNKKSMGLDLNKEGGRAVFYDLIRKADVLVEGSRPGVAERLKIDYSIARGLNPKIVYCSITSFGQDGPYRNRPGHDVGCLGLAAMVDVGEAPLLPKNVLVSDTIGALMAAIGILSALFEAQRSGQGQFVDLSLLDALVSCLNVKAMRYFLSSENSRNSGEKDDDFTSFSYPFYNVYKVKDGRYVTVAAVEKHFWKNLCVLMGREDFVPDQFAKGERRREIFDYFRSRFMTKDRDEWVGILDRSNVPGGPVHSLEEVFRDPQVKDRKMVVEAFHSVLGKIRQLGAPIKFSGTPCEAPSPAPIYGMHTAEILEGLGYSKERIGKLRGDGIIE